MRINPGSATANSTPNGSGRQGVDVDALQILTSGAESEPNDTQAQANAITLNSRTTAALTANDVDFFKVVLPETGRLTVQVHSAGLPTRLSLLDSTGQLLIQSDGQSPGNGDDRIVQDLEGGTSAGVPNTYFLRVEGLGGGSGGYTLTTEFLSSLTPFPAAPVGYVRLASVVGDFNGDGIPDLVTANALSNDVSVFLGVGDGTFQPEVRYKVGIFPNALAAGDFNGDGILDVAVANSRSPSRTGNPGTVSVLLGRGDGTFQKSVQYPVGNLPNAIVAGDVNGDGKLDLATANSDSNDVSVLLGNGDGTFQKESRFASGGLNPTAIVAVDLNHDGKVDLATGNGNSNNVSLLLGKGDGTFQSPVLFAVGGRPHALVVGDFNGDGSLDLATANRSTNDVSVLLGRGDGTFQGEVRSPVGGFPTALVAGDFNGDGILDLATADNVASDLAVLLGNGDGTFRKSARLALAEAPVSLVAGDFNRDGRLDLATPNIGANDVSMFLGLGDGTFQPEKRSEAVTFPGSSVAADFNGDGRTDLVVANADTNNVSVFLGLGDGTFQSKLQVPVGSFPTALVVGDFNGDGHPDLATANRVSGDVSVLLGNGDGTFQKEMRLNVGALPGALVVGDFNGDGNLDLASADSDAGTVSIFLGHGDGTFGSPRRDAVGAFPVALVAGDFNGDGQFDLAVANADSDDVSVLLGNGDGTFRPQQRFAVGVSPFGIRTGDFNGDGHLDLATVNANSDDVSVLLGNGDGMFQAQQRYTTREPIVGPVPVGKRGGQLPSALVVGDFNGDGHLDLATANFVFDDVSVLPGNGDGTFGTPREFAVGTPLSALRGNHPAALVAGDFNSNGSLDLATANLISNDVSLLLGQGNGTFAPAGTTSNPIRSTPFVADVTGDGIPDVVILRQDGRILVRLGRAQEPGVFDPPLLVNPSSDSTDPTQGFRARDLAIVSVNGRNELAALDAQHPVVALYRFDPDSRTFRPQLELKVAGGFPARIAAGDLTGAGLDDVVVTDAGSNQVFVYLQNAAGGFGPAPNSPLTVGVSPSDLALADVDGDHRLDIVVTNRVSGDVSVLRNQGGGQFSAERFRAGIEPDTFDQRGTSVTVRANEGTASLVAGRFDESKDVPDLIVTNRNSGSFSLLRSTGTGGFLNPGPSSTFATGPDLTAVVAGRFTAGPHLDVAILNEGRGDISIFLGDGRGGFTEKVARAADGESIPLSAGNAPTGLSVRDVNGDGNLDLVVGNEFGDVLVLLGNGDGTFRPYERVDRTVSLAVADNQHFVLGNQGQDRVAIQDGLGNPSSVFQDRGNGIQAPGAVQVVDVGGVPYLVVANSGANDVLVYRGSGNGQFDPASVQTFFAGTEPVGLTLADVNGDHSPDVVVANKGSNDVSILFGQGQGLNWTLTPGPRLQVGEGPVATTVTVVNGVQQLVVTNSQSNDVWVLPGHGNGFFSDQPARVKIIPVGSDPAQTLVGNFDGKGLELVTLNTGSNDLTLVSQFTTSPTTVEIAFGGARPEAAVAGDFAHSGFSDLIVANNADGLITLLLGGPNGLTPTESISGAGLLHPTSLALPAGEGRELEVFAAEEGSERVIPLTFNLDLGIPIASGPLEGGESAGEGHADLLPLNEFTLAIVATLVPGSGEQGATETPGDGGGGDLALAAILLTTSGLQGTGTETGVVDGGKEEAPPANGSPGAVGEEDALFNLVTGLENASRQSRLQARERLLDVTGTPDALADSLAAIAQAFREELPFLARTLDDNWQLVAGASFQLGVSASLRLLPALRVFGGNNVSLPYLSWQNLGRDLVNTLLRAGRSAADAWGDPLPLQLQDQSGQSAPERSSKMKGPDVEDPEEANVLPLPDEDRWEKFSQGEANPLAEFLVDAFFTAAVCEGCWGQPDKTRRRQASERRGPGT